MKRAILAAALLAGLWSAPAEAACSISTTGVAFGNYNVLNAANTDSTGTVTLNCGMKDTNIDIKLDKGGSATFTPRRMVKGAEPLTYNLYTDAGYTTIWGDGTGGTSFYSNADPPDNTNVNVTVYGRVPAGQDVTAGNYTDTVIATITW